MSRLRDIAVKSEKAFDSLKLKFKDRFGLFDPVIIYPYRGYGNEKEAHLHGRILEKEGIIHEDQNLEDNLWNNIHKLWKRYESDEIPEVKVEGEFFGIKSSAISNSDGYFHMIFKGLENREISDGWHDFELTITEIPFDTDFKKTSRASILICNQENDFGIISDVDDTIIKSMAMNMIKKIRIMLTNDAKSRVAFEGVDKLYRKLTAGNNPLFFVSGSSYNLYDMLIRFCKYHDIPKAPFFLRNIGLDPKKWMKRSTMQYKKEKIEFILNLFDRIPFIFIGDSGQKDPEIYIEILKDYPGRIKAIYIRHLSSNKRKKEMERMAEKLEVPFLIMDNSFDALKHAKNMAWID